MQFYKYFWLDVNIIILSISGVHGDLSGGCETLRGLKNGKVAHPNFGRFESRPNTAS